jgi:hypothetical protein
VTLGIVQAVGVVLLVVGAVRLLRGKGRSVLVAGCVLELVICGYYLVRYASDDPGAIGIVGNGLTLVALSFAIMPAIGLMLVLSRPAGDPVPGLVPVLAFVQAGATLIVTGILVTGLALSEPDEAATSPNTATPLLSTTAGDVVTDAGQGELWIVSLVQLAGVVLLIVGGVRLASGRAGALFAMAVGVQVALCVYWLLRGTDSLGPAVLVVLPLAALALHLRSREPRTV